ncbi:DUF1796 family putative cysteine peptidase [Paenibacillus sp. 481]|uniref:DUF1796 family putative cysteine peptidase n=1 Tax=Paenibacillus sp. 481 TaxID=2835869 RepID=UPI001E5CE3CA|nr:DUF1796 family putative cysteine peptidase [Paenibacillus sp. 481]UHA73042.1 hypothetical protein KIK04_20965 [Paenibacillus sp. 481]
MHDNMPVGSYDAIIGIGRNCEVAYQLRRLGLRDVSYPLDWFDLPDLSQTAALIQSGFEAFMLRDQLKVVSVTENGLFYHVVDQKSNCHSFHDFPVVAGEKPLHNYRFFYDKLQRRIKKFKKDLMCCDNLLMIRSGYTQQEIANLIHAIKPYRSDAGINELILTQEHTGAFESQGSKEFDGWRYHEFNMPVGEMWYGDNDAWDSLLRHVTFCTEM